MKIKNYTNDIPQDQYEVSSVLQDKNGTLITLEGKYNKLTIHFGAIGCICISDEGCRIETYNNNETKEIIEYQLNKFYGNPLFVATNDNDFTLWLKKESCGFSNSLNHYLIITINDLIDIASPFPPKISTKKLD